MNWRWEPNTIYVAQDGSEHQIAGFIGCLCGWETEVGKSMRREFDKHLARVLGS